MRPSTGAVLFAPSPVILLKVYMSNGHIQNKRINSSFTTMLGNRCATDNGIRGSATEWHVMYVIADFMIDYVVCYVILRALKWNCVIYTYSPM